MNRLTQPSKAELDRMTIEELVAAEKAIQRQADELQRQAASHQRAAARLRRTIHRFKKRVRDAT